MTMNEPTVEQLQKNIRFLLDILATEKRPCTRCGMLIWFVTNPKTGKRMPIDPNGLNHFASCAYAEFFRTKAAK